MGVRLRVGPRVLRGARVDAEADPRVEPQDALVEAAGKCVSRAWLARL
jgi:hypothetical protein